MSHRLRVWWITKRTAIRRFRRKKVSLFCKTPKCQEKKCNKWLQDWLFIFKLVRLMVHICRNPTLFSWVKGMTNGFTPTGKLLQGNLERGKNFCILQKLKPVGSWIIGDHSKQAFNPGALYLQDRMLLGSILIFFSIIYFISFQIYRRVANILCA